MVSMLYDGLHVFLDLLYDTIYNSYVAAPRQARKGGMTHGITYCFYIFCYGKYSCLLYLQMVGQEKIIGNHPKV